MTTIRSNRSIAALLVSVLAPLTAPASPEAQSTPLAGGDREMIQALAASGPHESIRKEASVFDRFVGTWDLECTFTAADGTTTHFSGEWIFGWVLDGRAIQDVLIQNTESGPQRRGTTVRFVDRTTGLWRIIWIPPASGQVVMLAGGAVGDRIVLEGHADGVSARWSFNDIQANSFYWRGETSRDGGTTWRVEQEMWLKRRLPSRRSR